MKRLSQNETAFFILGYGKNYDEPQGVAAHHESKKTIFKNAIHLLKD